MTAGPFDPLTYKATQSRDWSESAEGWRRWWPKIEEGLGPVGDRLLEQAQVEQGQRVLDLATGIGEPALRAARLVGPEGRVVGVDIAPAMLVVAAQRAAELELTNVEFQVMDAETLDLPESSFDAAVCRFGLMFLPDVAGTLAGIRRVLRPGGRLAASMWGPPERAPGLAGQAAVARVIDLPPPTPGAPGVFTLSDPDRVEGLFREAGFSDVSHEWFRTESEFASLEERMSFARDVSAPLRSLLAQHDEETVARVWEEIGRDLQPFIDSQGRVRLWADALLVSGTA